MAEISKINANNTTYDIKDSTSRAALAEVVDTGAKNLVQIMQDSLSIYNIVFSVNKPEGTIIITGTTASAYKAFRFFGDPDNTGWSYGIPIPKGTYVLSGLPSGASQTGVRYILGITTSQSDTRITTQIWDGDYVFTISNDTTRIDLAAYVPAGQDLSTPFVFKPMICTKAAWDVSHQFEPYALPNPTLTPAVIKAVDEGAKNIVHTQDITRQGKGYIATPNGDGTYTITGSRTEAGSAWFEVADVSAEAGSYMLSGGVIGIPVAIAVGSSVVYAGITAQEINAEISNKLYIHIMAEFNQSNINYVIKPMICTLADWNVSQKYMPYCPTMAEMADEIKTKATMDNVYGFGTAIPSNSNLNDYKIPGVFRIESSSIATTISNLPTGAAAGRLEVKGLNAADRYLQIYYSGDVIFQRRWNGSSWFTWYKFEGTAVT